MISLRSAVIDPVTHAGTRMRRMTASDLWPLLQDTAAVAVAWVIAQHVIHHRQPFFAPIAAFVSLNAAVGERGLNALSLLAGVILGIGVGELTLLLLGGGYGSLSLATFLALLIVRTLGGARVMLAQAAISAILTIAVANGEVGPQRITDALIGAGVALVFSQLLFSPNPLRLLRRVESNALAAMAAGLDLTAKAMEGNKSLIERAIGSQRELRDHLSELARMRRASSSVARHTLAGHGQLKPVVRENEDAGQLDLLGGSCLLLSRTSLATSEDDQRLLAPCIHSLSQSLAELARHPGDRAARQCAVDRSLEILRNMREVPFGDDDETPTAIATARIAVTDLMLFVGVPPDEAQAATRTPESEKAQLEVPEPPSERPGAVDRLRRSWHRWLR